MHVSNWIQFIASLLHQPGLLSRPPVRSFRLSNLHRRHRPLPHGVLEFSYLYFYLACCVQDPLLRYRLVFCLFQTTKKTTGSMARKSR